MGAAQTRAVKDRDESQILREWHATKDLQPFCEMFLDAHCSAEFDVMPVEILICAFEEFLKAHGDKDIREKYNDACIYNAWHYRCHLIVNALLDSEKYPHFRVSKFSAWIGKPTFVHGIKLTSWPNGF